MGDKPPLLVEDVVNKAARLGLLKCLNEEIAGVARKDVPKGRMQLREHLKVG